MAHIRRLLDIVACTTSFGGSSSSPKPAGRPSLKETGLNDAEPASDNAGSEISPTSSSKAPDKKSTSAATAVAVGLKSTKTDGLPGVESAEKVDAVAAMMCPPPRLGQFYDFFSFSHLTPPIQCECFV